MIRLQEEKPSQKKSRICERSAWLVRAEERLYGNLDAASWRVIDNPRIGYDGDKTTLYQFYVKEVGYAEIKVELHHKFLGSSSGWRPTEFTVIADAVNENHKSFGYGIESVEDFYIQRYGKKIMTKGMKIYDDGYFSPTIIRVKATDKKTVNDFIEFWKPLLEDYMRMVIEDKVARSDID